MQKSTLQIAMLSAWTLVASFARAQAPSATQIKGRALPFSLSAKGASLVAPAETLQVNPGANDVVGFSDHIGLPGDRMIRAASTGNPSPTRTPVGYRLWYNGDFDGVDGLSNELDTSLGDQQYAHAYDDFDVTDQSGWDVGAVFSNNLTDTIIIGATWEIRQGISPGNGGTLIASGMTVTPLVTGTGRSGFGYTEYSVQVNGIFVHLPPGNYFLNVTPIGDLSGRSFVSTTSGANAVGQPPGDNQNAFFDSNIFGADFQSTADLGEPYDFSMGVEAAGEDKLVLQSAFSRKSHGAAGDFDLPLPITGAEGIESRAGGKNSIYLTFSHNVVGVGSVASSCGDAHVSLDPNDAKNLIVTVQSRSCDAMDISLTVCGVTDDEGEVSSATLTYGKLIGDVDASGVVDTLDGQAIRAVAPAPVDSSNFRDDLNHDGTVNARDHTIAKSYRGEKLP
jgi:hypothetical protein